MTSSSFWTFSLIAISIIAGLTVESHQQKVDAHDALLRERRTAFFGSSQDGARDSVLGNLAGKPIQAIGEILMIPANFLIRGGEFVKRFVDRAVGGRPQRGGEPTTNTTGGTQGSKNFTSN